MSTTIPEGCAPREAPLPPEGALRAKGCAPREAPSREAPSREAPSLEVPDKEVKRREANRLSAMRSRERKRQRLEFLEMENAQLRQNLLVEQSFIALLMTGEMLVYASENKT